MIDVRDVLSVSCVAENGDIASLTCVYDNGLRTEDCREFFSPS